MFDSYTRVQGQLWEGWLDLMKEAPATGAAGQPAMTGWAEQVRQLTGTQLRLLEEVQSAWLRRSPWVPPGAAVPGVWATWVDQSQRLSEEAAEASRRMFEAAIEAGRLLDPERSARAWNGTMREAMRAWEEGADKLLAAQLAMLEPPEKEAGKAAEEQPAAKGQKSAAPDAKPGK